MSKEQEIIGIIAGGGQFPLMVAEAARKQGYRVVAVAHIGDTESSLSDKVDEIVWIKLGQLGQLIKALKKGGVSKALMAGTITKKRMFEDIRPDLKGLTVMSKLAIFHDDDILRAVAKELAKQGIEIVSSTSHLPELSAPLGCLTRRGLTGSEEEDVDFGWKVAKELGRLDIGQCVVVRKKAVLALEAIDGTDETILRGGRLAREAAVVVKVSKPDQDLRFDVPCVGLETLRVMSQVKASVLAVEAGKTLMFDRTEMVAYANKEGISIVSR
ncbi:MAG: UDP-2,3-diacylglucosamine diphosphatase LpxI [Deltaproteobacteria bacterium]|nr:UDP-2,3-diacylglucosamine diphosphatase LpxI [Deltaproteobacteria bacterium]MBW1737342.1 UDP-2,3-diacylglucosamine diphosphatase LpxI [Deltaproteobacteria bacterium]MBW2033064.1 UDP-2,3-diacylglucosamine diphosphatase LpxI [Deltaproteobacteria bacterium]MBW2114341.1 UDP-2,3-diacylglucosamine diphosphatase LpxI [Deltaproteobacteria bacterium]MBW2358047.1 UDP-2,3-diacylglucosamine diphosphatase LpxI [Deltaproteobacteria bacterium]